MARVGECGLEKPASEEMRQALAACAFALMSALTVLGEALKRIASSPEHPASTPA